MCATILLACPGITSESCLGESGGGRAVYVEAIWFGELRIVCFVRLFLVFFNQ